MAHQPRHQRDRNHPTPTLRDPTDSRDLDMETVQPDAEVPADKTAGSCEFCRATLVSKCPDCEAIIRNEYAQEIYEDQSWRRSRDE